MKQRIIIVYARNSEETDKMIRKKNQERAENKDKKNEFVWSCNMNIEGV